MESIAATKLAFLVYVNRSGSTFLASRLASVPGMVVTVESAAVGQLLASPDPVADARALSAVLDELYGELKFRQWQIDRSQLEASLAGARFPLPRESLFLTVLRALPGGDSASGFVVKAPDILPLLPELMQRYPSLRAIHVIRDPRAVYASQRRSVSSRTGRPMVQDPVTMARRWQREVEAAAALPADRLLELRYESMLQDEEAAIETACEFLEVDRRGSSDSPKADYAERIPETQRHLHTRVGGAGDTSRIESWRQELSPGEIRMLQWTCRRSMARYHYAADSGTAAPQLLASLPRVLLGMSRDTTGRIRDRLFGLREGRE